MGKIEAKKIIKRYVQKLKENNYSFKAVYLFGSFAKDSAGEWSDIDVAVVSDKLIRNRDENERKLWRIRREVDIRIEPHGFTVEDFKTQWNPMAYEVKRTGIRIA